MERHELRIAALICATVLGVATIIGGVAVYGRTRQTEVDLVRRTAPRPESPHERNLDRYLERFDRILPPREGAR